MKDEASPEWRYFELAENSNGVAFGLKSAHEVVLALDYKSPHLPTFEIHLGAEQNSLSKLNFLRLGKMATIYRNFNFLASFYLRYFLYL